MHACMYVCHAIHAHPPTNLPTKHGGRQTYELRRLMSQKSLRDVDMVPENGPNCYANLTAALNGEKQGAHPGRWTVEGIVRARGTARD